MSFKKAETMELPLVSFLIVTHNVRPYLQSCIDSALRQTYPQIEVVLVDNASTDGSVEQLAQTLGGHGTLRVVRSEKNLGPAGGAVLGLPHCRGEFIARLDADDIARSDRIERQMNYLREHQDKDAVGADVLKVDNAGRALLPRLGLRTEFLRKYGSKWEVGTNHTTLLMRRRAVRDRFYNPTLFTGADYEFIQWLARDGRLGLVPEMLCLYRQHSHSITRRYASLQQLTGGELHLRVSQAGSDPEARRKLAMHDFSSLTTDARLKSSTPRQEARVQLGKCLAEKDWLTAAYFASTSGRWLRFFSLLPKAVCSLGPWPEVVALTLVRTAWPVWKRVQNLGFQLFRRMGGDPAGDPAVSAWRLVHRFAAGKKVLRQVPAWANLLFICYLSLKPEPTMTDVAVFPASWSFFFDHHDTFNNVIGFAELAGMMHLTFTGLRRDTAAVLWRAAGLAVLVLTLEGIQYFLPHRFCDWRDILSGWTGIAVASLPWLGPRRKVVN